MFTFGSIIVLAVIVVSLIWAWCDMVEAPRRAEEWDGEE